ncbi:MAG: methyltransferase domain-containing protein [Acidobacteria bacterium]|nr:methyltransferase domain-containing protein [Acidobacteriota bacterium]
MKSLLFAVLLSLYALAQPSEAETEKSIAGLPPAERAFERYRAWANSAGKASGGSLETYRQVLIERGFPDAEAQTAMIRANGTKMEIARWNRILTAENPGFNTNPNEFLVEMARGRKPGRALDAGMGQGRNAIWLAGAGWDVTGFDPAGEAVALAEKNAAKLGLKIKTEVTTREQFAFGEKQWDLILLSYAGGREMPGRLISALKPGGLLIIEGSHEDAAKNASIGRGVVFQSGELVRLYSALRVVRYEEPLTFADFGPRGRLSRVVRYCAERVD